MSDGDIEDKQLASQLKIDVVEGESWHIEFKDYAFEKLDDEKILSKWKDDLSHEFTAFASRGARIYLGITDDGEVVGIKGTHQEWQEKLLERVTGNIKPKVRWKSYYFTDPVSKRGLIRIEIFKGEPMYYFGYKPYIREGTKSRPAEPEEVKEQFRDYFALAKTVVEDETIDDKKSELASWTTDLLIELLSSLNLYEDKHVNPQRDTLKSYLEVLRQEIESKLGIIRREFGENSDYFKNLETISSEIDDSLKVRVLIDGGVSWKEWLSHLKNVQTSANNLFIKISQEINIQIEGLDEQIDDICDRTVRWLSGIDETLSSFTYEAPDYARKFLRAHFLLKLTRKDATAEPYKTLADELEKLSWATSNTDYMKIQEEIPNLIRKVQLLELSSEEQELLLAASKHRGQIHRVRVDQIPSGFIKIGNKNFGGKDTKVTQIYNEALDSLITQGLVKHVSGALFEVTADGWRKLE